MGGGEVQTPLERVRAALSFTPLEIAVLGILGLLVVAGGALAWMRSQPVEVAIDPAAVVHASPSAGTIVDTAETIWVHIVGAVKRPGVYELDADARAIDAVRAAGGLGKHADALAINLARGVADGEQLVVPRKGASSSSGASSSAAGTSEAGSSRININTADAQQLQTLPGIGPALSQRIIEYRDQHGPFATTRDLINVSGIGEKTFAKLEPYVTV